MIKILFLILALLGDTLLRVSVKAPVLVVAPTISSINVASLCTVSVLINFNTSTPSYAHLEYGTTVGYGSSTLSDTTRFYKEHAIQITGLTANTLYHYRVVATDSGGTTNSSDQTFTTAMAGTQCPNLPAEVDSRMPDMSGAVEKTVKTSGGDYTTAQFQAALNDAGTANEKRIITVDAGLTIVGQYLMPANADQNWIIIRSSQHAALPEGRRVMLDSTGALDPTQSARMFKIQNTNVDAPIKFAAGSNHIRLVGVEVTIDPASIANAPGGATQSQGMLAYNQNVSGSAANLPKFIGVDRCYIHGWPNKNTMRGIFVMGEDLFFIDSYIVDFHHLGFDSQAILGLDIKRWRVLNCTLTGAGESLMWGGAGLAIPGYVITDFEYLRNHSYHPISWKENGPSFAGFEWAEKNLFELKTSAKVLMFGNYFGGTSDAQGGQWPDAQAMAINLKLEQNSGGPATCELMQDLTIYKNYTKNVSNGWAIVGRTVAAQGCTNVPERIRFMYNLAEVDYQTWSPEPGCAECGNNATGYFANTLYYFQSYHNTMINANPTQIATCNSVYGDGMMLLIGDPITPQLPGFVYRDNIADSRGCGLVGGGFNGNNATGSLNGVYTGWIFTNNGILRSAGPQAGLPSGNVNATNWNTQLVNFNNGRDGNYRVAPGSSWENAASDGTDIGADVDAVDRAVEFTAIGLWSSGSSGGITCKWSTNPPCN